MRKETPQCGSVGRRLAGCVSWCKREGRQPDGRVFKPNPPDLADHEDGGPTIRLPAAETTAPFDDELAVYPAADSGLK